MFTVFYDGEQIVSNEIKEDAITAGLNCVEGYAEFYLFEPEFIEVVEHDEEGNLVTSELVRI